MARRCLAVEKRLVFWHFRCHVVYVLNLQRIRALVGETVREMGLLILVFAPLDSIFGDKLVNAFLLAAMMFVGLLLVTGGKLIEARDSTA